MKKIFSVLLAILIIFTTVSCSSNEEADVPSAGNVPDKTAGSDTNAADATGAAGTAGTNGNPEAEGAADANTAVMDMGKEDNTRITVALSIPEDRFMEIAAKKFQEANPGIVVDIKYYTSMGETMTQQTEDGGTLVVSENTDPGGEKFIKTINTELMSGAGPDIIDTFYMPAGKFADNGFLCDMDRIIRQDTEFESSSYYENIINGMKYKDGLYTVPISFTVDLMTAKYSLPKETVSNGLTLEAFFDTASGVLKAHGVEDTFVLYDSAEGLFRNMLRRYYGEFVKDATRECDFTSGRFVKLIELIKRAEDRKLFYHSRKHANSDKGWEKLFFLMQDQCDTNYLRYLKSPEEPNIIYTIPSMDGESVVYANIFKEYGINNHSKSKGAAWKFIKFLLSEEMQTSPELYFFPVNRNAMAQKIEREKVTGTNVELTADDPVFSDIYVYADQNWQITEIIVEETQKYFNGQRTAEETARILQGRVDMMVKE